MDTKPDGKLEGRAEAGEWKLGLGPRQEPSRLNLALVGLLFVIGLVVRLQHLGASQVVAEVQFRSALIARGYLFERTESIPDWRKEANLKALQNLPTKEPSITECLVALIYRALGPEDIRIARGLTSVFWLVGGIFLYGIVKRVVSPDAAVVSLAYYLFVPIGVVVSTSFQPDPLMILMFVAAVYSILDYQQRPSKVRLVAGASTAALAILVKPLVLFALSGAFVSLMIYRAGGLKRVVQDGLFIPWTVSLVPAGLYYGHGVLTGGDLGQQAQVSFLPQLWVTGEYWRGWLLTASDAAGVAPLTVALLGLSLCRDRAFRALLIGLWGGYAVFCLLFSFHIRYAGYYHLQLVPIIALSSAPLAFIVLDQVKQQGVHWWWYLPLFGALLLTAWFTRREIRGALVSSTVIESAGIAEQIGDIVNHSNRTVYVASYYGRPLEYYGELSGTYWPRSVSDTDRALGQWGTELTVEERLRGLSFTPEYFVITQFEQFSKYHGDLEQYLISECSLVAKDDQYLIYGACSPR